MRCITATKNEKKLLTINKIMEPYFFKFWNILIVGKRRFVGNSEREGPGRNEMRQNTRNVVSNEGIYSAKVKRVDPLLPSQ